MISSARSPHQLDWLKPRPKLLAVTGPAVTSETTDIVRGRGVIVPLTGTPLTEVCPLTTFPKFSQQSPRQMVPGAPVPPKKSRVPSSPSSGRGAEVAAASSFSTQNTVRMLVSRVVKLSESPPSKCRAGSPLAASGTSCGRVVPVTCTRSLPLPDWSGHRPTQEAALVGRPASLRTQSLSPEVLVGMESVSSIRVAVATPLGLKPAAKALALMVVVASTTNGEVYSVDDWSGAEPSS